ncbi:MAG: RES family NAD+ phosphorylase [Luteimonas sp.]|nr:RES family NAD+ phosphorylase [Luteimonas sp.]
MNLDQCEDIFDRALESSSEAEFCHHITPLFDVYEILSVGLGRGSNTFWRARIAETGPWLRLKDLDYPPAEKARAGRLNDAGSPCFYLAGREETALLEVEAREGQLIQLAAFKIDSEEMVRLILVGEYTYVHKTGYVRLTGVDPAGTINGILNRMPPEDAIATIYIDRFFASILSDPHARDSGYRFSRALGAALHSRIRDADGIAFPSVRDPGGFNYAILPEPSDRVFRNVACALAKIGHSRRYQLVEYKLVGCADLLDDGDNFVWANPYQPGTLGMYGMTKEEFERKAR